jgi:hypothetical protein
VNYFWATLRHKWFVLIAGLRLGGIPLWRLLTHDLSKFGPGEYPHYQRRFYGPNNDPLGFALAWNHHENSNPHHWGHWIARSGPFAGQPLPMPRSYAREMVADWMGASRAYTGSWDMTEWLRGHLVEMCLHSVTAGYVREALADLDYHPYTQAG